MNPIALPPFLVFCLLLPAVACAKQKTPVPNTAPNATASKPPPPKAKPPAKVKPAEAVKTSHVVFIGKPTNTQPLDCANWDAPDAPRHQMPRQMHDASHFPHRHHMSVEVHSFLQGSSGNAYPRARGLGNEKQKQRARIALAVGNEAFRTEEFTRVPMAAYDEYFCERVNKLMASAFVVMHTYPVYVDHGNGPDNFWTDLGTDMRKANAGFATFQDAQAYAKLILGRVH